MRSRSISFQGSQNNNISAILDLPLDERPEAYALFAHCFTCSKNLLTVKRISRSLTNEGIAVFRFDFTGLGQSEGEFSETNFSSNLADLQLAADYLKEHYESPQLLIGHSLGGTAALHSATNIKSVKAVATIGSPFEAAHVKHMFQSKLDELEQKGEAEVDIGGRSFRFKASFLDDISKQSTSEILPELQRALLVFHSPQDRIVNIDEAASIYNAAKHPKSFVSLDGADHLVRNESDATYVGDVIASWARRYIPKQPKNELSLQQQVAVRSTENRFTTELRAGKHHFLADEPESVGGLNAGPAPYDLLLSALGACTSMTIKMYADHKGIDIGELETHLSHERQHKKDASNCDKKGAYLSTLKREIRFDDKLDNDIRKKLIEIANKCPVHRTLEGPIEISTSELLNSK